jgi:3-hydroxyisobutyrate dehydrogenase-like beta-hydroxyacid dehydrogenase
MPTTVGIVYPGEMGSALGRLLVQSGVPVIATTEGRGFRTRQLAEGAGLVILPRLRDVAERAEVVLSTVPPAAARAVAECFMASRPERCRTQIYADLNSVAPDTARKVADVIGAAGLDFVDGAIHGLASRLPERGTLYLSGRAAPALAGLLGRSLRVRVLGEATGQASAFKMMISGMAKGVVALFLEMGLTAHRAGMLEELLACYRDAYPEIMALVERMLPTYPRHAPRRAEEARQVEQTIRALGVRPCLARGTREATEDLMRAGLPTEDDMGVDRAWSVSELIEALAAQGTLEASAVAALPERALDTEEPAAEPANIAHPPALLL